MTREAEGIALFGDECCPRCAHVSELARRYADLMGLRDWEFTVQHGDPVEPEHVAEIDLHGERRLGRIRVRADTEGEELRHAITHELCHALTRDLMETVRGVSSELGGSALRVFLLQVGREEERLVDSFATTFGAVLPLP